MPDDNTQETVTTTTEAPAVAHVAVDNSQVPSSVPSPVAVPAVVERVAETDRMALELAKANKRTALAQAEKALSQNETAELNYKYVILQIYMKYGMNENDALGEDGTVLRGGAVQPAKGK